MHGSHDGVWECPDLFPINIEGTQQQKWVLLQSINPGAANGGSGTQYFVGDFDGRNFILDNGFEASVIGNKAMWLDWGRDNYAGVTWSDIPAEDGRRLFMGWMSNWDYAQVVPTKSWRSAMTIPRTLALKNTPKGLRLYMNPVKEIQGLRQQTLELEKQQRVYNLDLTHQGFMPASRMELELDLALSTPQTSFQLLLSNPKNEQYIIGYDAATKMFYTDRTKAGKKEFSVKFADKRSYAPQVSSSSIVKLQLFLDAASSELFINDGEIVMTDIFFPNEDFNKLELISTQGVDILKGNIYAME